jgi:ABC-type Zn2+ transport system substrate-binding protein/surface adhesin
MAEIGKVTPGPIVRRVPRDRTATDEQEHPPQPDDENNEKKEHDEEKEHKPDHEGGIDLYV